MKHKFCVDCPFSKVIPDPDLHDWFNDDDEAIVCMAADEELTKRVKLEFVGYYTLNVGKAPDFVAWHKSEVLNKPLVASALRPYETHKTTPPEWCPDNESN